MFSSVYFHHQKLSNKQITTFIEQGRRQKESVAHYAPEIFWKLFDQERGKKNLSI